jgi:hypothetical protein
MFLGTGESRCWSPKCAWQGNAQQLAEKLGLTEPNAPKIPDWGLPEGCKKYGVSLDQHGNAYFPLRLHNGNFAGRRHVRKGNPGDPRFWFSEPKDKPAYPVFTDWQMAAEWGERCGIVHLVEGNRDALTLLSHGWATVGLLGTERFQQMREIALPHLKALGVGAVVIVPDNDTPGAAAAKEWAKALLEDGYTVGVKALPTTAKGTTVKDTYDLFQAVGPNFDREFDALPVRWREP